MRQIFGLLFLLSIVACSESTQTTNSTIVYKEIKLKDITKPQSAPTISSQYGFDSTYELSTKHHPFLVTGYFNADSVLDSAILIRNKSTSKDALFIKHGRTDKSFLLKNGKDVGSDFDDFHWVGHFEVLMKGRKVWNNVVDGEIVSEYRVPDNKKITLQTDGIFIHEDEGGGGGIIYFENGKYVWVQQD